MLGRLDKTSPLPRYYQIYNALLKQIRSGELVVGQALPPERQIAKQFGVARLTVVKALDLLMRDGLIDKQQGRGSFVLPVKHSKTKTIAYIKAGWPAYHELGGISQVAFDNRYRLQMLAVDASFAKLESYIETCIESGVEGFIIYARSGYEDLGVYKQLLKRKIPLVMIDRYYPQLNIDRVTYDDEQAAFALTSKLIARGHQRIAVIPGFEVETTVVNNRLLGYRKALQQHGVVLQEDLMWFDLYNTNVYDSSCSSASPNNQLLEKLVCTQPTAVLTINDGIYQKLSHDLRYFEPELAILNEGDFALEAATFSYRLLPESSTLKLIALQPGEALGHAAARLLSDRLEGRHSKAKHVTIRMIIQELGHNAMSRKEVGKKRLSI